MTGGWGLTTRLHGDKFLFFGIWSAVSVAQG